jgi:hypothetical protein
LESLLNPWEKAALCLTVGLTAAVLAKLWTIGVARGYKALFFYLTFDFLASIVALSVTYVSNWYGYFYVFAQTTKIVIAAFVLVEIYSLALEHHQALARFGRGTVSYVLAAAALIPVIGLILDKAANNGQPYLRAFLLFEQTMDATIALFLIFISIFMAWFPVRLRRNVVVYITGFVVWSLTRSVAVHLNKRFIGNWPASNVVNSIQICITVGCLLFWLLGLRRAGEIRTAVVGHLWNRAEGERLAEQLDAINGSLERLRRK